MRKKYMMPAISIVTMQQRMGILDVNSLHSYNEKGSQVQFSRSSSWDDEEE